MCERKEQAHRLNMAIDKPLGYMRNIEDLLKNLSFIIIIIWLVVLWNCDLTTESIKNSSIIKKWVFISAMLLKIVLFAGWVTLVVADKSIKHISCYDSSVLKSEAVLIISIVLQFTMFLSRSTSGIGLSCCIGFKHRIVKMICYFVSKLLTSTRFHVNKSSLMSAIHGESIARSCDVLTGLS